MSNSHVKNIKCMNVMIQSSFYEVLWFVASECSHPANKYNECRLSIHFSNVCISQFLIKKTLISTSVLYHRRNNLEIPWLNQSDLHIIMHSGNKFRNIHKHGNGLIHNEILRIKTVNLSKSSNDLLIKLNSLWVWALLTIMLLLIFLTSIMLNRRSQNVSFYILLIYIKY